MESDKSEQNLPSDWGALLATIIPVVVLFMSDSMVSVALPAIRDRFWASADLMAWVVAAFTLPYVIFMPFYGRLGDGLGKRKFFLLGIILFQLGTALSLLADSLPILMAGRAIQGFGGAGIVTLSIAIISESFGKNRLGKALGLWNSAGVAAVVLGLLLAGLLTDYLGWRAIFVPGLAIGLLSPFIVWRYIPGQKTHKSFEFLRTFDWGGTVFLAAAVTSLLIFISSKPITGVEALKDWRLLIAALVLFTIFIVWEKGRTNPCVALDTFNNRAFTQSSVCSTLRMVGIASIFFLVPLYLADIHRLSASLIGGILMIHTGALLFTMFLAGQVADRWKARWLVTPGIALQAGSIAALALLPGTVSLGIAICCLIGHGLGAGMSQPSLYKAAMQSIPKTKMGAAAGLYSMVRFGGEILGTVLAGVLLQRGLDQGLMLVSAHQLAFLALAGLASVGIVVGLGLRE